MYSIYHFFQDLVSKKTSFLTESLDNFPFSEELIAFKRKGQFPDMVVRVNLDRPVFTGGELIELKSNNSYNISSFNSTIPSGRKEIAKVIQKGSDIWKRMVELGDPFEVLPVREVFYLVRGRIARGRKAGNTKVCLVHGSFFETVESNILVQRAFNQILLERLQQTRQLISEELRQELLDLLVQQEDFSRVRNVENSSVKIRFRIMTEASPEGNILNSALYPRVAENSLNFVLPCDTDSQEQASLEKMKIVFGDALDGLTQFRIKHHFNGYFLVFQTPLSTELQS